MDTHTPLPRLLAANGNGQRILDLRDGTLRVDLGATSLRFTNSEFSTLVGMLEAARLRRDTPADGLLAYDGARCGIWRCPQYGTLALVVDRAIVRLAAADVAPFAGLCRKALNTMRHTAPTEREMPAYTLN